MARLSEKIGYGLGDMSSSMFWKIFSYYLPVFYSDVFGLKPAHAAILLLVTKIYDAVSDPVMGLIADRTDTRWGRYRPWLLWVAVPFAVAGVLSFYVPGGSYTFKHVYAYLVYILMMTAYTAVNVPYGAMLGVVTDDSAEKTVFSSFRMFFAYVGSFISVGIFSLFEKRIIGTTLPDGRTVRGVGDTLPSQWTGVIAIVAALCAILFILCFALTREHVRREPKQWNAGKDLGALLRNKPWWLLLGAGIGQLLFLSIRGGAAAYYFANILGTNIFITCAVFLAIGELSQMAGVLLAVPVSKYLGKKGAFLAALLAAGVLSLAIAFLPSTPGALTVLIVLQVLIGLLCGITSPLIWSMFADVADYSAAVLGSDSTALIFSSSSMSQKIGGAFGGFLLLIIVGACGYDSASAVQSESALSAIKAVMSYVPAAGALLGSICLLFYPLSESVMKEIRSGK